ncbi:hypothetical protein HYS90_01415 [Candidatus Curtissbacteria bacterium]|nr:hypothetical protein [Candidatus Curtissbacteria bacterium]
MVEILDAGGRTPQEAIKEIPSHGRRRRQIYFDLSKPEGFRKQTQVLAELAKHPEYSVDSYLSINSTTKTGRRIIDILNVPFNTPDLMPHKHTDFKEGETYLVDAWDNKEPMRRATIPVLADSPEASVTGARRRASEILGINKRLLRFQSEQVSLEKLLEVSRRILLEGGSLPFHIMRLGDLQELAARLEHPQSRRQTSLPKAS